MEISSVACGFSSIKIDYYDYQKSLISRINEVYVFFNKFIAKAKFYWKNINFIYNRLFCCNHTCYCVNMISVTLTSHYIMSASLYHLCPRCTSVVWLHRISRNWPRLFLLFSLLSYWDYLEYWNFSCDKFSYEWITDGLCECTVWSAPVLFAYNKK